MRGQVKIVAYGTPQKLTVTVLGLKNLNFSVDTCVLVKLSITSEQGEYLDACTFQVQMVSKEVTVHETNTFDLSKTFHGRRRLLIEAWSQSITSADFIGCTSFGLRNLVESSEVVQGSYYFLNKSIGCRKHVAVKTTPRRNGRHNAQNMQTRKVGRDRRQQISIPQRRPLVEHKEIEIPVAILLNNVNFGFLDQSPPSITNIDTDVEPCSLRRRDVILEINGTAVSFQTNNELQETLRTCDETVTLKVQRINSRRIRERSSSLHGTQKRKLRRRPAVKRKRRRLSHQDQLLNSPTNTGNLADDSTEQSGQDDWLSYRQNLSQFRNPRLSNRIELGLSHRVSSCRVDGLDNKCENPCSSNGRFFRDINIHSPKHIPAYQPNLPSTPMCMASLTYGTDLQKSAKIIRRGTYHNNVENSPKCDKEQGQASPFVRRNKGRRSLILGGFSTIGKTKTENFEEDEKTPSSSQIANSSRLSVSEADLTKVKGFSAITKSAKKLPFGNPPKSTKQISKFDRSDADKLKKLFRMRSRLFRDEKVKYSPDDRVDNVTDATSCQNSLLSIMKDKGKCGAFRSFLAMEYSEENLSFWMECESYKSKKPNKQRKAADAIYRKFIQAGANHEVNITSEIRNKIRENIGAPSADLFVEAQESIFRLMESDPYKRFIKRNQAAK